MTTSTPTKPKFHFISNPFKSSFDGINNLFKHNQTMAIVILILSFFGAFANMFSSFPTPPASETSTSTTAAASEPISAALVAVIVVFAAIFFFVSIFVSVVYTGIVNYVAWKSSRGETTTFGEAFSQAMKHFWRILGIQIVVGLKIFGGLLLFIVPGIRASLRYQMVFFAMFDEKLNAWKSMDRVKQLTKNHLMEVFGIMTVGQLLFPVAVLVQIGGESVLYPQLKHLKDNNLPKPPIHWLNYLGFILLGALFVFISFIVTLVAIATQ